MWALSEQYVQYPVGLVFCQRNFGGPKSDYHLSTGSYIHESCANPAKPGLDERSLGTMKLPLRPHFMVAVTFADLKYQQASSPMRKERHEEEDGFEDGGPLSCW